MASSSRQKSTIEDALLRQRVKELEEEVSSCKKRLDDLRKAKNTTILKREREVLEVNAPKLGMRRDSDKPDPRLAHLQKQLEESERQKQDELNALRKKFQAEIEDLKHQLEKPGVSDDSYQVSQLMLTLDEVRGDNTALVIENRGLQDQVHQLMMELSEKEALWCEREEEMNKKLNEQWGEKYAEWISKVDHKMDELQQANATLQGMLKKKKPPGPDPSGQDSS